MMDWAVEHPMRQGIVGGRGGCFLLSRRAIQSASAMSRTSRNREYAQKLATIFGDPFQEGIIFVLQRSIVDFQRIPTKPSGDGGLDGLSHEWTRAYCCYGLDLQASGKTKPEDLREKIVSKFREDLQKLCELKKDRSTISHEDNTRLAAILTGGKKLAHIQLITNYLEDNRIIGDLSISFATYKSNSKCKFIDPGCTMSIWGPDDICNYFTIDDAAMLRIENPSLATVISEVENTAPHDLPPLEAPTSSLDEKIMALAGEPSDFLDYKDQLLQDWSRYILFMQKLNSNLPNLHRELEALVKRVSIKARLESNTGIHTNVPTELIGKIENAIEEGTKHVLSRYVSDADVEAFKDRTVARLIGMCPLDWRKGKK